MKRRTILSYVLVITMIAAMLSACGKEKDTEAENVLDSTVSSEITTEAAVAADDVENQTESESEEPTETTESTEPDKTTEAPETAATTEPASEPAPEPAPTESETPASEPEPTETPATSQNEDLPGKNRNGRYPDIPESVLPASQVEYFSFLDEPRKAVVYEDLLGKSQLTKIYSDYAQTIVLKEATTEDVVYIIAMGDQYTGLTDIAIYNDQYVCICDAVFQQIRE